MKRVLHGAVIFLLVLLFGCGGSNSDNNTPTPQQKFTAVSLSLTPSEVLQGTDGGRTTITGALEFKNASTDVSSIVCVVCDGRGVQQGYLIMDPLTEEVKDRADGVVHFAWTIPTDERDVYLAEVYVTDKTGNQTNNLAAAVMIK